MRKAAKGVLHTALLFFRFKAVFELAKRAAATAREQRTVVWNTVRRRGQDTCDLGDRIVLFCLDHMGFHFVAGYAPAHEYCKTLRTPHAASLGGERFNFQREGLVLPGCGHDVPPLYISGSAAQAARRTGCQAAQPPLRRKRAPPRGARGSIPPLPKKSGTRLKNPLVQLLSCMRTVGAHVESVIIVTHIRPKGKRGFSTNVYKIGRKYKQNAAKYTASTNKVQKNGLFLRTSLVKGASECYNRTQKRTFVLLFWKRGSA